MKSNSTQKDREIYISILKNYEIRDKWIKVEKLKQVIKQKMDLKQIKQSSYFIYNQQKDAIKINYPYSKIVNMDTLLEFMEGNRLGIELNEELKLAYPDIQKDLQSLETKMWISSTMKRNQDHHLITVYFINELNFKKDKTIDVYKVVPRQFQYQYNPQFFYTRRQTNDLCDQFDQILTLKGDCNQNNKLSSSPKQQFKIKNLHLFESDNRLYNIFQEAMKEYEI